MKRVLILLFLCLFVFSSCSEAGDPTASLGEFVSAYGAEGIIYSTDVEEGQEGYISPEIERTIFGTTDMPPSYAIFLNTHLDYASECGAFLVRGDRSEIISLCKRRISLLDPAGDHSFIAIYGDIVFYSTMSDAQRARRIADVVFR